MTLPVFIESKERDKPDNEYDYCSSDGSDLDIDYHDPNMTYNTQSKGNKALGMPLQVMIPCKTRDIATITY